MKSKMKYGHESLRHVDEGMDTYTNIYGENGSLVARTFGDFFLERADLMAAAPDMRIALEAALQNMMALGKSKKHPTIKLITHALRKARRRS